MLCPRDRSQLQSQIYEADIQVDRCASCRGVWLDATELERIQSTLENEYAAELGGLSSVARAYEMARQKPRADITCPKCGGAVSAREYGYCSQILVDTCADCGGVWLDSGELQALEQFFERERAHANAPSTGALRRAFWGGLRNDRAQ